MTGDLNEFLEFETYEPIPECAPLADAIDVVVLGGGFAGLTPAGIETGEGELEFDAVVCATGFDALTGAAARIDIAGRGGTTLRDKWADGPQTYLGPASAGFPNLFFVTGPGSPGPLSAMVKSIEQHVDWISDCLVRLRERGIVSIEADAGYERDWVAHVQAVAEGTLYPRANSWYLGANVPGKSRRFMPYLGGVGTYRAKCDEVTRAGYEGFSLGWAAALGDFPERRADFGTTTAAVVDKEGE